MGAGVRFGVQLPTFFPSGEADPGELIAAAKEAEGCGFDSVWTGDHLRFTAPSLEAFTALGAVAAVTERVRIGTAVLLLGLRDTRWAARSLASLDVLSSGRVTCGVGVGAVRDEWDLAGRPFERRGRLTDEAIEAVRELWGSGELQPSPVQASLPLWIGGRSEAALERTARVGDAWVPASVSPDGYARRYAEIVERARSHRRDAPEPAVQVYVAFDDAEADAYFRGMYGVGLEAMDPIVARDADRVGAYVEAGARHVVLHPAVADRVGAIEPLRRLADSVGDE